MPITSIKSITLLVLAAFVAGAAFGQSQNILQTGTVSDYHYFIVNDKAVVVNQVDLVSNEKLDCDKRVFSAQLFNVFLSPKRLVLFTVLPSGLSGKYEYKKIDTDAIKPYLYSLKQLDSLHKTNVEKYQWSGYRMDRLVKIDNLKIIIKKDDGYYVNSSDCLTEIFEIGPYGPNNGFSNQNPIDLIDISNVPLTTAAFEKQYAMVNSGNKSYNHADYGGFSQFKGKTSVLFYSHQAVFNGLKTYFFWTLSGWITDIPNTKRGIDRFIYEPGIGVIGGDYAFYFRKLRRYIWSDECENTDYNNYLANKVKLNPVKITKITTDNK